MDVASMTIETRLQLAQGIGPYGIELAPAGDRIYTANPQSGTVSGIDLNSLSVADPVPAYGVSVIALSPEGREIFAGSDSIDRLQVIYPFTRATLREITVGEPITGLAVSPDGTELYVTHTDRVVVLPLT